MVIWHCIQPSVVTINANLLGDPKSGLILKIDHSQKFRQNNLHLLYFLGRVCWLAAAWIGHWVLLQKKSDEMQNKARTKNLSIDDDSSTNGDEGRHCVKAEWDAKKGPAHLKSAQSNQLKYG